jgi:PAS domain S-box-containing protein
MPFDAPPSAPAGPIAIPPDRIASIIRRLRALIPPSILVLGAALSFLAFDRARLADHERVERLLAQRAEWSARDFREKIVDSAVPVQALAIFLGSQEKVDSGEFHGFALQAGRNDPVSRLTWAPLVRSNQRAAFEDEARRQGFPSFAITDSSVRDPIVPAPERESYAAIRLEERFEDASSIMGFDFLSEPYRRAAVERARDTGMPIATAPITPITGRQRPPSYSVFWPVYRAGEMPETVAERRAFLIGFASGSFPVDGVVRFAFSERPDIAEQVGFFIGRDPDLAKAIPFTILNSGPTGAVPDTFSVVLGTSPLAAADAGGLRLIRSFEELGQTWTLVFDFPSVVVTSLRASNGWAYLALGLVLTFALTLYVVTEQRRRRAIERIVTERTRELQHTTEHLRRSTDQLTTIIEASGAAIICLDANRDVMIWNRTAVEMFGYTSDEAVGHRIRLGMPEDREESEKRFSQILKGEILRHVPSRRRRKDGRVIDTTASAAAFYDAAGALQGIIFTIEDVTGRNQIQEQLRQAQKMEAIGQLTGGMAHDFNNLLGIVLGNVDLLAERHTPGSEEHQLAEAAVHAATRGAELTRQLLAFARQQPLAPKRIDLAAVLHGTAKLLRRTLGGNIKVELKVADDIWPLLIDVSQLESAILNLAVNARDAMPDGGTLTIETTNTVLDQAIVEQNLEAATGDYVVIAVSDTGTGMPAELVARAFEPFFTTKGTQGTGLGLSMVHGFVRQSGGYTKIYSEPGSGTTIRIYLPRSLAPDIDETSKTDKFVERGNEVILVVEDNKGMRDITVRQLQTLGYRTVPVGDSAQALEILGGGAPVDLIFTDVVMPGGMDGRALARAARQLRPQMRILFTSGFTGAAASAAVNVDLGNHLLSKPYRKEELARRVRSSLDSTDLWSVS